MRIFILAAGKAERWDGKCKHLADINGIPLINHTLSHLEGYDVTVVTKRKEIIEVLPADTPAIEPENNTTLLDTIISTCGEWDDERTTIMLGDVVWTSDAIEKALSSDKALEFFASDTETFAITFSMQYYRRVISACNFIIGEGLEGTTHQLYRMLAGIPLDKEWHDRWIHHRITDKTDDIDYPDDYQTKIDEGYFKDKCFEVEE